jgi:hypothetical protein
MIVSRSIPLRTPALLAPKHMRSSVVGQDGKDQKMKHVPVLVCPCEREHVNSSCRVLLQSTGRNDSRCRVQALPVSACGARACGVSLTPLAGSS